MTAATINEPIAGTTWQIDPDHSSIEFSVKHLMIASVKGRFGNFEGGVSMTPGGMPTVTAAIGVATINTNSEQRDAHLRSPDFFDADGHPTMSFSGTSVDGDLDGEFRLNGNLTIRGTTRPIVLEVSNEGTTTDPWGNTRAAFIAKGRVRRSEFGLTWNQALETGGVMVGDEVKINIDVSLVRQ